MAAATDLALVDAKLEQLIGAPAVGELRVLIREGEDRALFRINTYAFTPFDYFGQTVKIAARVQSIAGAVKVCMTAAVHDDLGVRARLARFVYRLAG